MAIDVCNVYISRRKLHDAKKPSFIPLFTALTFVIGSGIAYKLGNYRLPMLITLATTALAFGFDMNHHNGNCKKAKVDCSVNAVLNDPRIHEALENLNLIGPINPLRR